MSDYDCRVCEDAANVPPGLRLFIVCRTCGNKRCPKASWHEQACTGSNEPGQAGSFYGPRESWPAKVSP